MKSLQLITSAFRDLSYQYLSQTQTRDGYAFIIHPRDIQDVYVKYPFLRFLGDRVTSIVLRFFWPVTVSEIQGAKNIQTGKAIRGWIISSPLTPSQLIKNRALAEKSFIKAVRLADRRGAKYIGLGALAASLTKGGYAVKPHTDSIIVTGRLFTAKIISDLTVSTAKALDIDPESAHVSIVGAAGSIGSSSAQLLAKKGFTSFNLVDLSNKKERLSLITNILRKINSKAKITHNSSIDSVKESDFIIAATNREDALLRSEHLKPGSVVVDDAQPSDVDPDVIDTRDDVLVIEGGVVHAPGINPNINIGLQHKEDIYSCLAEVIIMASLDWKEHYNIGELTEIDFDEVDRLENLSVQFGFSHGEFQNFKKVYSQDDIEYVKKVRLKK